MSSFDHPVRLTAVDPFQFGQPDGGAALRDIAPRARGCFHPTMNESVTYQKLIAEHDAIEAAAKVVVTIVERAEPNTLDATHALEALASLLRDHLSGEDAVIYDTILAARGGQHAEAARVMGAQLEQLKEDWVSYLYRWDAEHIAANWPRFAIDTADMLGRLRERVALETMILYSLALHFDVIAED